MGTDRDRIRALMQAIDFREDTESLHVPKALAGEAG